MGIYERIRNKGKKEAIKIGVLASVPCFLCMTVMHVAACVHEKNNLPKLITSYQTCGES